MIRTLLGLRTILIEENNLIYLVHLALPGLRRDDLGRIPHLNSRPTLGRVPDDKILDRNHVRRVRISLGCNPGGPEA